MHHIRAKMTSCSNFRKIVLTHPLNLLSSETGVIVQSNHVSFFCYLFFQLIKTHNLLPSRNYIFGYHPHGIFSFGAFCNFGTEATGFSKKFPGIKPSLATLAGNFRMPVFRDYLMSGGEMVSLSFVPLYSVNC